MSDRAEFESWLSDFLDIDADKLVRRRRVDEDGMLGYVGLESEGFTEDADDLATIALQAWQAARAQGGESVGEVIATFDGSAGKVNVHIYPYAKLDMGDKIYTHPAPSQAVPDDVVALVREAEAACQDPGEQTLAESKLAQHWLNSLNAAIGLLSTTPQPADNSHEWGDGMRCTKCGDKDLYAELECKGRPGPPEHTAIFGRCTGEQIGCTTGDPEDVYAEEPGATLRPQPQNECPVCNEPPAEGED